MVPIIAWKPQDKCLRAACCCHPVLREARAPGLRQRAQGSRPGPVLGGRHPDEGVSAGISSLVMSRRGVTATQTGGGGRGQTSARPPTTNSLRCHPRLPHGPRMWQEGRLTGQFSQTRWRLKPKSRVCLHTARCATPDPTGFSLPSWASAGKVLTVARAGLQLLLPLTERDTLPVLTPAEIQAHGVVLGVSRRGTLTAVPWKQTGPRSHPLPSGAPFSGACHADAHDTGPWAWRRGEVAQSRAAVAYVRPPTGMRAKLPRVSSH